MDGASTQLVAATRVPIPAAPGQPARIDDEYERKGTAHLFMVFEPLAGQRQVKVTDRRTAIDFAHVIQDVVDEYYPQAEKLVLVMDNLNTHTPAALYEAFPPAEARRLLARLEIHHTPKHGSWLNLAETELSVLVTPMPGPTASRPGALDPRSRSLGKAAQHRGMSGRLAVHDPRCPHQAEATLPVN